MTDEFAHLPDPPDEIEVAVLYAGRTPRERTVRTLFQVFVSVLAAVVPALAAMTAAGVDLPAGWFALGAGISSAGTILISAGVNAYDQAKGRG